MRNSASYVSLALAALIFGLALPSQSKAAEAIVGLPPYTAAYEPTTVDERGLWQMSDEHERWMRDSPLRIRDGNLETYLQGVLCRTVGAERCNGVRVYAMEIPRFNATMSPNGAMEVWSGLLLRARNEAELAAVLGHEFAHFELRHSVAGFKNQRNATDMMAWLTVLGGISNTPTGTAQISLAGSMFRFGRDQETAADLLGLEYLAKAGYPSSAASEIWQSLMAEEDAKTLGRKLKPKQKYTTGFFDSHPATPLRASYLAKEAAKFPADGDARAQSLQEAIVPYLPRFLAAQTKLNDFGGTEYILSNVAARAGWTGEMLFARGELYRARANPRDLQLAGQFYREAKAAGYAEPEVDRNLGLALLRNGQEVEAREALAAYLAAKPDASDAGIIQTLVGK